ncbi:mechanosensitive ion channel family protein [Rhodocytophaga aerolata]|uniref:Mechanosensitive ion channel family protein n=1 Tax=Rhodocytophaga aerolata TaxID=455078 RepID=A0ABT8REU8_9BACT|nr:mechanosensitive ion channel family protein [Rhodocytophaga aerolata]MDO1450646.1 mechanosensitive ion channel family protein [Rhodocytophaga aerolata]
MQEQTNFHPGDFITDFTKVLTDYWERFLFLLPNLFFALIILVVAFLLSTKIRRLLSSKFSGKAHDQITAEYIAIVAKWAIVIVGILLACQALGLSGIAGGLLAGAGVSAVVVGFAFKDIAQNFLAGLILAFNRPFNVHDTVQINDVIGKVAGLDLRTTHIRTFDSKDVYIPNGIIITTPITNYTRNGLIRIDFIVGIDYNDDIAEASRLIEDTAIQVEGVLQKDPPYVVVDELATNTVNLKVFFWTETDDYKKGILQLKGNIMMQVKKVLLANGYGLPANIQELKLYDHEKHLSVEVINQSVNSSAG